MARKSPCILDISPKSWHPYLELTRIQKPAGLMGFYFPYLIGLFFAASTRAPKVSGTEILQATAFLLIDGLLLRSGGCAWNDIIDQDLDRQVARCKGRPMARNAISKTNASIFAIAIALARTGLLACMPQECLCHGLLTSFMAIVYPFMKRVSHYPQLWLGTAVGWGVFLASSSIGVHIRDWSSNRAICLLFASQTLWNITYDIVYAFQDLPDDVKAGVMSMAVRFQHQPKYLLSTLGAGMSFSLLYSGNLAEMGFLFATGSICAIAGLVVMLIQLDVHDALCCRWFFTKGQWVVSGCVLAGLVGEYLVAYDSNQGRRW